MHFLLFIYLFPDVSEDILAKYRTKSFVDASNVKENCDSNKSPKGKHVYNNNSEEVNGFKDIKNKLRLVLRNTSEIPHYVKVREIQGVFVNQ